MSAPDSVCLFPMRCQVQPLISSFSTAMLCRFHSPPVLQLYSWHKAHCESLLAEYNKQDYKDLMNSTFALVPGGRSPATYRLGEVLSAGCIPVFVHEVRRQNVIHDGLQR